MTAKEGLTNQIENIKPIMLKCKAGQKLTKDEQTSIVNFYVEVSYYLLEN
jgi:hypothetical protein